MPERPLHFAAFAMNTTGHIIQGTSRRPTERQADFNSLDLWVDLAKTLERGGFDAIFFADVVGLYASYRGDERKYVEVGLQVPSNDPSVLASAIAYATEHLGIAFTASILQEHPFNFARRISHPRPRQQRPGRVEHRHQLPAQRIAQLRARRADEARRALRLGR
jgi:long-chain alkane monooxygenase